jgi:glycosyltransferase involved in cell wall biosynthesis
MAETLDFLVIIPTFRRPEPLRAAITSALCQPRVTKRIIVVDDCPDGSAAEVVRTFPEVVYLKNPKPSGGWPGRVRNVAFDFSREMQINAHYVHFLDDDDTVSNEFYAVAKETLEQHRNVGVVFGVMRPFSRLADNPERQKRQESQLQEARDWRVKVTRFPWLYQQIGAAFKLHAVARWLLDQHATFGPEMFLCSGAVIRHGHILALGGFPDVRITEDYWFYTAAIRKFGALFLKMEVVGYGVGDPGAMWNISHLEEAARAAHKTEWMQALRLRRKMLQAEMGTLRYYARKLIFYSERIAFACIVIPVLDCRGYFTDLYRLTNPNLFIKKPSPEEPNGADRGQHNRS